MPPNDNPLLLLCLASTVKSCVVIDSPSVSYFPPQTAITIMNKSSQDAHTILDYHPTHYCCYFPLLIHSTCPKEMKIAVCHDD